MTGRLHVGGGTARTPAVPAPNPMGEVPVDAEGALVLTRWGVIRMQAAEASGRVRVEGPAARREGALGIDRRLGRPAAQPGGRPPCDRMPGRRAADE